MKAQKFLYSLRVLSLAFAVVTILFSAQIFAQENTKSNPLKKSDLVKTLESNAISSTDLIERIKTRGVDFQITESVEKELKSAGANDEIIKAVHENYTEPKKKKGLFDKIGGGLTKTAKIAVKTAPIVVEQMPQVQAAKAVINATKTASKEIGKEKNAKEIKPAEETNVETPNKTNGEDFVECPIEQKKVKNGAKIGAELAKKIIRCKKGERAVEEGDEGAVTVEISAIQIGAARPWTYAQDSGNGKVGTLVYPVKANYTIKTHYRKATEVEEGWVHIMNFYVNAFGEWEIGSEENLKSPKVKRINK